MRPSIATSHILQSTSSEYVTGSGKDLKDLTRLKVNGNDLAERMMLYLMRLWVSAPFSHYFWSNALTTARGFLQLVCGMYANSTDKLSRFSICSE